MELSTVDSGKRAKDGELAGKYGRMEHSIRDTGLMIWPVDKED